MDWWSYFLGAISGLLFMRGWFYLYHILVEHPYRWSCPEDNCGFKTSGNNQDFIDRMKIDHRRWHLADSEK